MIYTFFSEQTEYIHFCCEKNRSLLFQSSYKPNLHLLLLDGVPFPGRVLGHWVLICNFLDTHKGGQFRFLIGVPMTLKPVLELLMPMGTKI